MQFEIPMYNVSRLAVQYLKIANPTGKKNYNPHRWVRYVTQSSSYVVRTWNYITIYLNSKVLI